MKIRLKEVAEKNGIDFNELLELAKEKLPQGVLTGRGKGIWIPQDCVHVLQKSLFIDEITPKHRQGIVVKECPNPRFVWVLCKEINKKMPVMIPRKMFGKLKGKLIMFEEIRDDSGASYRYVKGRPDNT
tara:strand:- start:793 stop:1179 length:387 start_codon:yes stop_codon:yes gene_type:complete